MSYEFQKLNRVEKMEELPTDAAILVETNNQVKRVNASAIGGGEPIIIRSSDVIRTASVDGNSCAVISDELMGKVSASMHNVFSEQIIEGERRMYAPIWGYCLHDTPSFKYIYADINSGDFFATTIISESTYDMLVSIGYINTAPIG